MFLLPEGSLSTSRTSVTDIKALEIKRYHDEQEKEKQDFFRACESNNVVAVHRSLKGTLFSRGIDANFQYNSDTPLCVSVRQGYIEITRLLLDHKAQVNFENGLGRSALLEAVLIQNEYLAQLLLENKAILDLAIKKSTVLHYAVDIKLSIFKLVVKNSTLSQINSRDAEGRTPLYHAAQRGSLDSVKILIEHGADPKLGDHHGITPLDLVFLRKDLSDKMCKNFIAALANSIQQVSNNLVIILRRLEADRKLHIKFAFDSVLKSVLFEYSKTTKGQTVVREVITKSLNSKEIIKGVLRISRLLKMRD